MLSLPLMLYRKNLKNFVNPSLIRSELDLTCSQAFNKVRDLLMNDTTQYKQKLHFLSTHKNLPRFYIEIYFVFS